MCYQAYKRQDTANGILGVVILGWIWFWPPSTGGYSLLDETEIADHDTIYRVVHGFHLDTGPGKKYQYEKFSFVVEFLVQKVGTPAPDI